MISGMSMKPGNRKVEVVEKINHIKSINVPLTIPCVHHVLNDVFDKSDLTLRYTALGPIKHGHHNRQVEPFFVVRLGKILFGNSVQSNKFRKSNFWPTNNDRVVTPHTLTFVPIQRKISMVVSGC
jgi:hypothetical protein